MTKLEYNNEYYFELQCGRHKGLIIMRGVSFLS